jgi:hypothetical protein
MVDAVLKVLTFFVVVILILLLLNTLGGFIAAEIPDAVGALRRIIEALWNSLQDITQHYRTPHTSAVWLVIHGLPSPTEGYQ